MKRPKRQPWELTPAQAAMAKKRLEREIRRDRDLRTKRRTSLVQAVDAFLPDVSVGTVTPEICALAVACINLRQLLLPPSKKRKKT